MFPLPKVLPEVTHHRRVMEKGDSENRVDVSTLSAEAKSSSAPAQEKVAEALAAEGNADDTPSASSTETTEPDPLPGPSGLKFSPVAGPSGLNSSFLKNCSSSDDELSTVEPMHHQGHLHEHQHRCPGELR
ncbi:unnamed protein product, partial [Cyprideis torosa]